ncbi:Phenylacetate 2-hydroxylase [Neolecta irregularis DAH-3]|uniref:Phenylacetate 2-hydroxylase n=1 Tax=Neolecta irregularis (strain DAH-3) TaxID=1198029 RepID=A0A1U7LP14_NEOID|nr:Phenylacetate 2-hydroxylase [Neolecta irregularis DAH-3]|eukprot:OLL24410.1 Phenylacetate 2-hydroxylase [Neolecta irregularis DAH-3]
MPIIDLESYEAIRDLFKDSNNGQNEINPKPYFQRYALNTSLTLNYGTRMRSVKDDMLNEIIQVEAAISRFRSTSNNWQDYLPLLRIFPQKNTSAVEYRKRRDAYLNHLLEGLKSDIEKGIDKPCITGNILKDPNAKLNAEEVKSICLTMVSAGLDTVPANLIQGVGYLSSPHGQEIQDRAYQAIMEAYPHGNAWVKCLEEEKIPYLTAFVKEVLRFYTVIPMCLPRQSIKDIIYEGVVIPSGTLFYMNAQAADMGIMFFKIQNNEIDPDRFQEPEKFNPSRYLDQKLQGGVSAIPHYAYGAGSRMCAGSHLGNRELFTAFTRLISAFKILPEENFDSNILNAVSCNMCHSALVAEPKDFKVRFVARDREALEGWLQENKTRCQE